MAGGVCGLRAAGSFRGVCALWLCREPQDAIEGDAQNTLVGAGCRQVQADLGFHLDHPRGDLDEAQSQRCAGCAVGGEMRLQDLMWFSAAPRRQ